MIIHARVPDAEVSTEELERRQKRRGKWIAVGVIYILLVSTAAAAFGIIDFRSQTNHHAASSAQQQTIIAQGVTILHQQHENHNLGMANHKLSEKIQKDAENLDHDGQTIASEFGLICASLQISSPLCHP